MTPILSLFFLIMISISTISTFGLIYVLEKQDLLSFYSEILLIIILMNSMILSIGFIWLTIKKLKNQNKDRKKNQIPSFLSPSSPQMSKIKNQSHFHPAMHEYIQPYSHIVDGLPIGVMGMNQQDHIMFINDTLCQWIKIKKNHLMDQKISLYDFIEGHTLGGKTCFKTMDGKIFHTTVFHHPLSQTIGDQNISYFLLVIPESFSQDRKSHPIVSYDELLQNSPMAIVFITHMGKIIEHNQYFCQWVPDSIPLDEDINIYDFLTTESQSKLKKYIQTDHKQQPSLINLTIEQKATQLKTQCHVHQMITPHNDQPSFIIYMMDISQIIKLEEKIQQTQKMQTIGQLTGGIAHDFNNILTAIMGFCDLLLDRHKSGDPSFSDIVQIKSNSQRAAHLVTQLLAFSRQQTLQPEIINVTDELTDLSILLKRVIGPHIELTMTHDRFVKNIKTDPGQFNQVIMNLVINARDAMPNGGKLKLHSHLQSVPPFPEHDQMKIMPQGDYVKITIQDSGEGIAKQHLDQIFNPFFSTKKRKEGTGLGLSTVYGIIKQTQGFIFVDSQVHKGSTFTLYFPEQKKPATPKPLADLHHSNDENSTQKDKRIILVEDEKTIRMFLSRALEKKGYLVHQATHGKQALELINNSPHTIDLVISDILMPGMNGHELSQILHKKNPELNILLISGYNDTQKSEADFLHKPFSIAQMYEKIEKIFENKI